MKKINFNNRYGLTQAVIEGRKPMTRRIEGGDRFQSAADLAVRIEYESITNSLILIDKDGAIFVQPLRYKVGEVVAVAQSYEQAGIDPEYHIEGGQLAKKHPGWRNKMFVKAELMPRRIRITGVRCERLQDITDAECLKEGVRVEFARNGMPMYYYFDTKRWQEVWFDTSKEAFASLIDKVSGKGTWDLNPWVVVYEFELVK